MSNLVTYSFLQSSHSSELAIEKTALGHFNPKENDRRSVSAASDQPPHFDETECSDSDSVGREGHAEVISPASHLLHVPNQKVWTRRHKSSFLNGELI